tara:strand:- start:1164 stop:1919 length:756 start_codon:yes stop_codon:yes gene_type:complete
MSDYQKIEVKGEDTPPMNPEQAASIEQETTQEVPAPEATNERPGWLPEKFETPEAMAFAYKQLEQEFSKANASEPEEVAEAAGIDPGTFSALSAEFDETGDVSEESRQKLAATGIPREFIDEYVQGQKQMAEAAIVEVYKTVGGEEQYKQMLGWAVDQLSEGEIDLFNEMVAGSKEEMMMAVSGLHARYAQSGQVAPKTPLMQGETSTESNTGGAYQSRAQVVAAMKDERYRKDPAYREEVYRRLQNSNAI